MPPKRQARRPRRPSRRDLLHAAGMGVFGLGAVQAGGAPAVRKRLFRDPTGTSPNTLGVIRSGNLLFVSGIGGWYAARRPAGPGNIREQTGDALEILAALLDEAGSSMANLVKVQVALVDPVTNWGPMNDVYDAHVPEPRPVRSYFGSSGFRHPGQLLQLDAIAWVE